MRTRKRITNSNEDQYTTVWRIRNSLSDESFVGNTIFSFTPSSWSELLLTLGDGDDSVANAVQIFKIWSLVHSFLAVKRFGSDTICLTGEEAASRKVRELGRERMKEEKIECDEVDILCTMNMVK